MISLKNVAGRPIAALDDLGGQLRFYVRSLAWSGRTLRRYRKRSFVCWPR
jgi:phospholipid/cholesterol/gamma-HCH transport system permease protein